MNYDWVCLNADGTMEESGRMWMKDANQPVPDVILLRLSDSKVKVYHRWTNNGDGHLRYVESVVKEVMKLC